IFDDLFKYFISSLTSYCVCKDKLSVNFYTFCSHFLWKVVILFVTSQPTPRLL
ncbi:unnamed protein product, partial [Tenebrio molitor]